MKRITVLSIPLMFSCTFLFAQEPNSSDSLFIVTYTTGPAWVSDKSPGDQAYFKEHSGNLSAWRKEGIIKFGARYADKGIIFITAKSMQAARERIDGDPGVANGLFRADIQKLQPFYYGCVEKTRP